MWDFKADEVFARRFRHYRKKHPLELKAVLDNLDTCFVALRAGVKPQNLNFGFVHHEPSGVRAIDQKGAKGKLAQTRLYVYADEQFEVLHLITIGDKNTQHQDIQYCKRFVEKLNAQQQILQIKQKGEETHGSKKRVR